MLLREKTNVANKMQLNKLEKKKKTPTVEFNQIICLYRVISVKKSSLISWKIKT